MNNTIDAAILVDAHVHIYDCFEIDALLDAALHNFGCAAQTLGLESGYTGVLLLAETGRDNWFQRTLESCIQGRQPPARGNRSHWQIDTMPDKTVLQARKLTDITGDEKTIYIMAGRQIISAERLELLALVTDRTFEDGLPLPSALSAVREQDAIPVLPWAVGKWWGKRGKLLSTLLKIEAQSHLYLGDNSGRPIFWRNPSHFRQARIMNISVLPGTDSLPFPSETRRVGSFGFMMRGKLTKLQPSTDIKLLLRDGSSQMTAYGQLETPLRFFVNQIRLRIS